jgi:Transposase IS4
MQSWHSFSRLIFILGNLPTSLQTSDQQEKKKTVQVVEQLVEPFVGTYRTIYVDRFYTSIDLLKWLTNRQLFLLTGTVLANRIPLLIRTAKTSSTFKKMNRGDAIKCRLTYTTKKRATSYAGLVCWRDRNMVYCLSNDTNNFEFDECSCRGIGGIFRIPRPLSIANYNKYMGSVNLAEMRQLHCNCFDYHAPEPLVVEIVYVSLASCRNI